MLKKAPYILLFLVFIFSAQSTFSQCGKGFEGSGVELVVNGDFSQGNTGFSSQYLHIEAGTTIFWGQYDVGVFPPQYYNQFSNCLGHTTGNTSDSMLIVDGSDVPGVNVWCQTINVNPNTDYLFSSWAINILQNSTPANLQFSINGVPLGSIFSPNNLACDWAQFFSNWNSGANTTANICLLNQNNSQDGNDFAIDDISFQECICKIPVKDAGNDTAICAGETVQLSSDTTTVSYLWLPNTGLSANNIPNPVASPTVTTTYTLSLSNGSCINSDTVKVIVSPTIVPNTSKTDVLCFGSCDGIANATNTGGIAPFSYSWSNTSTTASISNLCVGTYTVTITDSVDCPITTTVSIAEPQPLNVTVTTLDAQCGSADGEATASVTGGTANYTYSWLPAIVQTTTQATGLAGGSYSVTVTDANGCTDQALFTIQASGGLTSNEQVNYVSCNGGNNGSITVSVNGSVGPFTYSWSTNPIQTNATVTGLNAGTYTYSATDQGGCVVTDTVLITEPSSISLQVATQDASCGNNNDGIGTATVTGGAGVYSYSWLGLASTGNQQTGLAQGIYTLQVTDGNLCTQTTTFTVSISGSLTATENRSPVSCFGLMDGSATVSSNSSANPITYSWNTAPPQTNALATSLASGSYTYTITDALGCSVADSVFITQPTDILVSINGPSSACSGQQVLINSVASGGTSPYQYSWSDGSTDAIATVIATQGTLYAVTITDDNGCTKTSNQLGIDLYPPISLTVNSPNGICVGTPQNITLTAQGAGGDANYTYSWLSPLNQNQNSVSVAVSSDTTFVVVLNDGCGSLPDTAIITISTIQPPTVLFVATDTVGCAPWCVKFNETVSASVTSVVWDYGNGVNDTLGSICYKSAGVYDVSLEVSDANGCTASYTRPMNVVVYENPVADFSILNNPLSSYDTHVLVNDLSTGAVQWYWNFGDSTGWLTGDQTGYNYVWNDEEGFEITLAVESVNGCLDTIKKFVEVHPDWTLYVPNTFTPGSEDIYNNIFQPKGVNINKFEMWIFDRWGNKIFYSNDINVGWDGRVEGGDEIVQMDTYVYYISFWPVDKTFEKRVGHVNVIR